MSAFKKFRIEKPEKPEIIISHDPSMDTKSQEETKPKKKVKVSPKPCNCKKSKCLKMYCECYASGRACTSECQCCDCNNSCDSHNNAEVQKQ
mgnify:CR=1 FL=1